MPFQDILNAADMERGKHGDEMVSLFTVLAAPGVACLPQAQVSEMFDDAANRATQIPNNLSAQFYAQGLSSFAEAFRNIDFTVSELPFYIHSILSDSPDSHAKTGRISQGQLLKVLIKGLSAWEAYFSGSENAANSLGMGYLFDLGISYVQARQKSSSKLDAVVDVAVNHSPLKSPKFRSDSGRLVIAVLLTSILNQVE